MHKCRLKKDPPAGSIVEAGIETGSETVTEGYHNDNDPLCRPGCTQKYDRILRANNRRIDATRVGINEWIETLHKP